MSYKRNRRSRTIPTRPASIALAIIVSTAGIPGVTLADPSSANLPISRVTLYTSGVGYFERAGAVDGDATETLLFPAKLMSHPHERYDTSLGKCLPGSPAPFYLYPPEIDLWGATFAAGVYTGTAFFFP